MTDSNKIIYLTDYIAEKKSITTMDYYGSAIELSAPKPELFKRSIALGIDFFTILLLKTMTHTTYALFINEFMAPLGDAHKSNLMEANTTVHLSTFMLIYYAYFLFNSYVLSGKTLGKMALGLRVVREDYINNMSEKNYELTLRDCFRRATGYLLCYLSFGTFFIFNFSSEDKRGLPDYISNSRTVSDKWLYQMQEFKAHQLEQVRIDIKSLELVA